MIRSRHALRLLLRSRGTACEVCSPAKSADCSSRSLQFSRELPKAVSQAQLSFNTGLLRAHGTRGFASSSDAAEQGGFGRNLQVRLVRTVAFGMILVAATKVVPLMFQSTVPHAVGLCDAKEPIMQKAAASRVSRLAESDASLKELVDAGVVHKLLAMLKPEVDEGVADAVLCAIKELSRLPEGREALKSAGATAVLAEAVEQQWLQGEHSNTQATKIRNWLTVR
ncbi:hypothetical protein WJX77_002498 [Trebouxia sp. C0004]